MSLATRLTAKSERQPNGCLLWTGGKDRDGYGKIRYDGHDGRAHRAAYQVAYGEFDPSLHVLHACDTPSCVEPSHLFLGTNEANIADKCAKGRAAGAHRGEDHHLAKLNPAAVKDIRRMKALGARTGDLARRFGVSPSAICDVVAGRRWGWLP